MAKRKVVLIHGLWLHASSWRDWIQLLQEQGYTAFHPPWPGEAPTVQACRQDPAAVTGKGVRDVADHYASFIAGLEDPPVLVGHSFGGLIAQILLGRGLAAAAIALDPAPLKGVWQLPFTALRASLPVLANPFNRNRAFSLTFDQFRYGFANALTVEEARLLYDLWTIPSPARPLFQAATATFTPAAETKVSTQNRNRGPLLITGGSRDHIAPPVLGKATAKKYPRGLVTDFKLFENRGHSLVIDHGWREVAGYCLDWLQRNGF